MSEDKELRELFPALTEEMESTEQYKIDGVRGMDEESKPVQVHYTPSVVDYIRRCENSDQAVEIVEYLLKQGEISQKEARAIKSQLKTQGIRSFGSKREKDHYLHHGVEPE